MRNKDKLAHSKNKHNSLLPKMKKKNLKFPKCWKTLASERGYEKERERECMDPLDCTTTPSQTTEITARR